MRLARARLLSFSNLYAREAGLKRTLFCVTQYTRKDKSDMALISVECTQAASVPAPSVGLQAAS